VSRTITYREALTEALREELGRDPAVLVMGEDVGAFGGAFGVTDGLQAAFGPTRVRDTPISENAIVGLGVGAAMTGLRPVVELMTVNFGLPADRSASRSCCACPRAVAGAWARCTRTAGRRSSSTSRGCWSPRRRCRPTPRAC
jgi:pyruvate/2-oxoglutarate/acetoin dehydrogenase E1 component